MIVSIQAGSAFTRRIVSSLSGYQTTVGIVFDDPSITDTPWYPAEHCLQIARVGSLIPPYFLSTLPGRWREMSTHQAHLSDEPIIALHARFGASEALIGRDQEICGENQPADRIYQVVRGAVRSCRLLADGRRQICAFRLSGGIFGLENGATYRSTAEAIVATRLRVLRRHSLDHVASLVACNLLNLTAKTFCVRKITCCSWGARRR